MKNWSAQIFPIVLLGIIAALTFWLQAALAPEEARPNRALAHEPDAIAENFEIRRLDDKGQLKYRLNAPHLQHFPDDDSSEIRAPRLITYRQDAPPVTLIAGQARITAQGENVILTDKVEITRAATEQVPALVARTATLNVLPDAGTAQTDQPVEISQGASWVTGVGARIDNNASTFELLSQVRGQYVASRVKP